jgi:ferric enterobactin receptor
MYRRTGSINWRGNYGGGKTSKVILSYEGTTNHRIREELSSGGEDPGGLVGTNPGGYNPTFMGWSVTKLDNYRLTSEFNTPLSLGGVRQMLTFGAEYSRSKLDDPYAMTVCPSGTCDSRVKTTDPEATETLYGFFIEDNIEALQDLLVIPGVRLDHHDEFGFNWSPYLNAHYTLTPATTIKAGIARAFKAPNLYQLNPNYFQGGCRGITLPVNASGCGVFGNADLDPEISINKEIGIAWADGYRGAGLTFFQNDYSNKIVTDMGMSSAAGEWYILPTGQVAFHWNNSGKAVVRGVEGHLNVPILQTTGRPRPMWRNNLTYMDRNHNKETGQPLSMVPKYTVNSQLEWNPTEQLSFLLTATFYGKQKPRTHNTFNNTPATGAALETRDPYHILGLSAAYSFDRNTKIRIGINNLEDKRLQRLSSSSSRGANNYNETGRAYYATLSLSF